MELKPEVPAETPVGLVDQIKHHLADPSGRIKLDDLVTERLKDVLSQMTEDQFPPSSPSVDAETVTARLERYTSVTDDLQTIIVLLAYWAKPEHLSTIRKCVARVGEFVNPRNGRSVWCALYGYPMALLTYLGGIAAIAGENYEALTCLLLSSVQPSLEAPEQDKAIYRIGQGLLQLDHAKVFDKLPDYSSKYAARSEYLYDLIRPKLEELIFVGQSYEDLFDRFEILLGLVYVDLLKHTGQYLGSPFGRFGWKYKSRDVNPYRRLVQEAERRKSDWSPIAAGFFGGSYARFESIIPVYKEMLNRLP